MAPRGEAHGNLESGQEDRQNCAGGVASSCRVSARNRLKASCIRVRRLPGPPKNPKHRPSSQNKWSTACWNCCRNDKATPRYQSKTCACKVCVCTRTCRSENTYTNIHAHIRPVRHGKRLKLSRDLGCQNVHPLRPWNTILGSLEVQICSTLEGGERHATLHLCSCFKFGAMGPSFLQSVSYWIRCFYLGTAERFILRGSASATNALCNNSHRGTWELLPASASACATLEAATCANEGPSS